MTKDSADEMISVQEHEKVMKIEQARLKTEIETTRRRLKTELAQMRAEFQQAEQDHQQKEKEWERERKKLESKAAKWQEEYKKERSKNKAAKRASEGLGSRENRTYKKQKQSSTSSTVSTSTVASIPQQQPLEEIELPKVAMNAHGRPNRFDVKWRENFEALLKFKQVHGHLNIPFRIKGNDEEARKKKQLASWVNSQRTNHKRLREGLTPSHITPERIQLLNKIGFEWQLSEKLSWEERIQLLQQYKDEFGHVNVPQSYKGHKNLGDFVMRQRREHTLGILSQERTVILEGMGIRWRKIPLESRTRQEVVSNGNGDIVSGEDAK